MSSRVSPGPQSDKPSRSFQQPGQTTPPNILHMTFSLHLLPAHFPEAYGSHELPPLQLPGTQTSQGGANTKQDP